MSGARVLPPSVVTVRVAPEDAAAVRKWWGDTFALSGWAVLSDGTLFLHLPTVSLRAAFAVLADHTAADGAEGWDSPAVKILWDALRGACVAAGVSPEDHMPPRTPASIDGDKKATRPGESTRPPKKADGAPDLRLY